MLFEYKLLEYKLCLFLWVELQLDYLLMVYLEL